MKKIVMLAGTYCLLMSMFGCGSGSKNQNGTANGTAKDTSKQGLLQTVKAAEAKVSSSQTLDAYNANLAISAYLDYAKYFPTDTLSAAFLHNAGMLASSTQQYGRAITLYENVVTRFPQSRLVPECLFTVGFLFEDKMKDTANAHKRYSELIEKFPTDHWADQARGELKYLGISSDELGKKFEEMNKDKTKDNKKTRS
jgi:TolA-binding protein